MTDFFGYMESSEVIDVRTFANYVQQRLGTPFPSIVNLNKMKTQANNFFSQYPDADWPTLVRVVEFCKARKRRPAHCYGVMGQIRHAYAAGYLPELEPRERADTDLESEIAKALIVEQDAKWRERLMASTGVEVRRKVYVAWCTERQVTYG